MVSWRSDDGAYVTTMTAPATARAEPARVRGRRGSRRKRCARSELATTETAPSGATCVRVCVCVCVCVRARVRVCV